jgi:hypothetical protein
MPTSVCTDACLNDSNITGQPGSLLKARNTLDAVKVRIPTVDLCYATGFHGNGGEGINRGDIAQGSEQTED